MNIGTRTSSFAERRPGLCALLLALAHGLLFLLALPPFDLWALAFLALAPLMLATRIQTLSPGRAFVFTWLGALPFWFFQHRWLIDVTAPGYPALNLLMSCYPALFVWAGRRLARRPFFERNPGWHIASLPLIWTGLEFFRGQIAFNGYPWFLISQPTIEFGAWAALGRGVGVYGVSLLTAAPQAALVSLALANGAKARRRCAWALACTTVPPLGVGWFSVPVLLESDGLRVNMALVQTAVPQSNKMGWTYEGRLFDMARFLELTVQAAHGDPKPDFIVWPETMYPGHTLDYASVEKERAAQLSVRVGDSRVATTVFHDELLRVQSELGIPMVVGAIAYERFRVDFDPDGRISFADDAQHNSAFVLHDGAVMAQRYDKLHLTPFGEVMPYISSSDWLEKKLLALGAAGMSFRLSPGASPVVLEIPLPPDEVQTRRANTLRIATPICFEATNPALVRRLVYGEDGRRRADMIVQLTNDGWFGRWAGGREHHMQMARWRAVELGVPVVRAANTGISAHISPSGQVRQRLPDGSDRAKGQDGVLSRTVHYPPAHEGTLFGRIGDVAGRVSLAAATALFALALAPSRKKNGPGANPAAGSSVQT